MAVPAALLERFRTAAFAHLPEAICPRLSFAVGGTTRTESINLALKSLLSRTSAPPAFVAVHDAARPYVTADALKKCLGRLKADASLDGALVGRPCTDTVHTVDEAGLVIGTPPRAALCAAETPQVFRTEALLCAYAAYAAKPSLPLPTDEADLVLRSGPRRIAVVMTGEANPKITYATDLP
jgi:2-C-methyl-D-erythritol 4-phosphate cytidylyltransferase